jgi:hydroxymethylpyrimidine pyrophosphatase-like HAD family hydrolase
MKMIVASDLDRTLMYSNRALEEFGRPEKGELTPVELSAGTWVGYMTDAAFSSLKQLSQNCLFIPVTTRTTAQFKRFVIFEKEIPLTYAITTNGASILYKGEPLSSWSEQLLAQMKSESARQEEVLAALKKEGFRLDGQRKQAEKLFFYFILNSLPPAHELLAIRGLCAMYGWRTSLQGRKLYIIPNTISKGNALQFICEREGMPAIAGAGDSILDWDFLKNCQNRYVPIHGELKNEISETEYRLIHQPGVLAGEEIIKHFQAALSQNI